MAIHPFLDPTRLSTLSWFIPSLDRVVLFLPLTRVSFFLIGDNHVPRRSLFCFHHLSPTFAISTFPSIIALFRLTRRNETDLQPLGRIKHLEDLRKRTIDWNWINLEAKEEAWNTRVPFLPTPLLASHSS